MKKYIFLLLLCSSLLTKAQITWEHTYDSASTWNTCNGNINQLMIVDFEADGEHYVKINRCGRLISIYDMNHTLVKNIPVNALPIPYDIMGDFLYFSEHLFDIDDAMEYMYVVSTGEFYTTYIYKEDGSILFTDTGAALIHPNFALQQWPIYNTSVGTKMILSYANGQAKVFGLPGELTTAIAQANTNLVHNTGVFAEAYPNPSQQATTIHYELPSGVTAGEIVFYNLNGAELKRFQIDNTFNTIFVTTNDLEAGTYFYQLQTEKGFSEGKKLIVIK